jgi:hypothetical protein
MESMGPLMAAAFREPGSTWAASAEVTWRAMVEVTMAMAMEDAGGTTTAMLARTAAHTIGHTAAPTEYGFT